MSVAPGENIPVYRPVVTAEDVRAIEETAAQGWLSGRAPHVAELERRFAAYCGGAAGAATSSGTAALEVALTALRIGPGDEVLCPSLTIISCARAILAVGATPVLVDVDPASWGLDVDAVAARIGPRTRAVLAVHLFGFPADLDALAPLRERGIHIVEDAAQAIGAEVRVDGTWHRCGAAGDLGTFSFYANKAITTGEGGMVVGGDAEVVERARRAADLFFGAEERFRHDELGPNYRMNGLGAALGLAQLARIDAIVERKKEVEQMYREALGSDGGVRMAEATEWMRPVPWMAAVVIEEVEARSVIEHLAARGVEARPFFVGMHAQPALAGRGVVADGPFPVTDRLSGHGLYLPSSFTLDANDVDRIVSALTDARGRGKRSRPAPRGSFGPGYARLYDAIYADKPYEAETRAILERLAREAEGPVERVLDLGCGTGRHAEVLAAAGLSVTAVDRSAAMVALAEERCAELPGVTVETQDVCGLDVEGPLHDAAVMLFTVLGYVGDDDRIVRALVAVRRHVRRRALLVADVWDADAVISAPPASSERRFAWRGETFVRRGTPSADAAGRRVAVRYRVEDGSGSTVCEETHEVRYFDAETLRALLERASFELVSFGPWSEPTGSSGRRDYTAYLVARAV